jgi:hypothetical protein
MIHPVNRAAALAWVAAVTAKAGDRNRAYRLAADAEAAARTIPPPSYQAEALARVAAAVVLAGDRERADRLIADAEARPSNRVLPAGPLHHRPV